MSTTTTATTMTTMPAPQTAPLTGALAGALADVPVVQTTRLYTDKARGLLHEATVRDPLMPASEVAAYDAMQGRVAPGYLNRARWAAALSLPIPAALIGCGTSALLGLDPGPSLWLTLGITVCLGIVGFGAVFFTARARQVAARRTRAQILARWEIPVRGAYAVGQVTKIAADVAALPPTQQADLVPLMDTVREICAALMNTIDGEATSELYRMLYQRANLVKTIRVEAEAIEARLLARDGHDQIAGMLTDGADLRAATLVRDSLAAYRSDLDQQTTSGH